MFCSYNAQGVFHCKKLSTNNKLSNTSPCNCSSNKIEKYTLPSIGPPPITESPIQPSIEFTSTPTPTTTTTPTTEYEYEYE
jgi:hypothetical protein